MDEDAARAATYLTDDHWLFAALGQGFQRQFDVLGTDAHRHADAAIEGAVHLGRRNLADLLQPVEDLRPLPGARVQHHFEAVGHHARDVLRQPPTRDVRTAADLDDLG